MRGLGLSLSLTGGSSGTPAPIVNNNNTSVTGPTGGFYRITKTGGTSAWGTGGAVGVNALTGDFLITARALATNQSVIVAVNVDATADDGYLSIDRGLAFSNDGRFYSIEDGGFAEREATYSTANYYYVRRVGTTVTVLKNTVDNIGTATLLATLTAYASTTYVDIPILEVGAAVDVRIA